MDTCQQLLFVLILSAATAPGWCQTVEEMANSLQISFTLNENYSPGPERCNVSISLRNIGTRPIVNGTWNIYFCSVRMVEPDDLIGDNIAPKPEGFKIPNSGFTIYHVAGCLFRLAPNDDFSVISPGKQKFINYTGEYWIVSRTDIMPYFYIASSDGEVAPIPNTMDQMVNFATPFSSPRQYKRLEYDAYSPYSPQQRLARYVADDNGQSPMRIIPQPVNMSISTNTTILVDSSWVVFDRSGSISFEATYLAEKLRLNVTVARPSTRFIELVINPSLSMPETCAASAEHYTVTIEANRVIITGADSSGVFYGVQTFLAISDKNRIGTGTVSDCPRFGYRGFMADVGRHFLPMEEILRILDFMAMYKLNKFHFHLSDDEGFRVEIPGLPELTTVGATQCHDPTGDECIMPQLGSPPTKDSSGSGYYTVEEYKDILQYAANLHIQVIPEIDMPGHAHAIIKAMESRHRNTGDDTYILWDPEDVSRYLSVQYFTDNAMNPCINSTYTFVEKLVDAFIAMHSGIQTLEIFHWGGDEVPGAWLRSPACERLQEEDPSLPLNATVRQLKVYFATRVKKMIHDKGLHSAAWEDGVLSEEGDPIEIPDEQTAYVNAWSNVWEWGAGGLAYRFANSGYKSIISHATHTYFDHPVEPDPEDRGYYWATRFTDMYKAFSFVASDIYKNIDVDRFGRELDRNNVCADDGCPPLMHPENIAGIQGQVWQETMRTPEHMHSMVFPRLIALAERAWHEAAWESIDDAAERDKAVREDWQDFASRIGYKELLRLDALGIKYDIRPPAIVITNSEMTVKTEFPGLRVELSTDSGLTWTQYYQGIGLPDSDTIYVTKSADGSRRSRPVRYIAPVTPPPSHASSIRTDVLAMLTLVFSVTISL